MQKPGYGRNEIKWQINQPENLAIYCFYLINTKFSRPYPNGNIMIGFIHKLVNRFQVSVMARFYLNRPYFTIMYNYKIYFCLASSFFSVSSNYVKDQPQNTTL